MNYICSLNWAWKGMWSWEELKIKGASIFTCAELLQLSSGIYLETIVRLKYGNLLINYFLEN